MVQTNKKPMKTCTTCHKEKDETAFYTRKNLNKTKRKVVYRKSMCIECTKKAIYKWKAENPERFKAYQKSYQERIKAEQ